MKEVRNDYTWVYTDEPHRERRTEMLKKYPQIKKLYGYDPISKFKTIFCFLLQIATCYLISRMELGWFPLILLAYAWGGTINHSLMLAVHELSHDLFFPKTWQNEWFGIFASFPLAVPISLGFKKYHLIHHQYQGISTVDPDLPTRFEGNFFSSATTKFFFLLFQPLIYIGRPLLTQPSTTRTIEILAFIAQITFDYFILYFFGGKALSYLFLGAILGSGLHPLAAHFVAEHYIWTPGYETYSYYGPLNKLVYNVGYHNEHHDFPRLPGSKLPELHKIAPEFYKNIGKLESWPGTMWRFIFDPTITPYSRVLRKKKEK